MEQNAFNSLGFALLSSRLGALGGSVGPFLMG
jgi:hypothetical protein